MENKDKKRAELLQKLFAQYPAVTVFFLTSDDQAFTQRNDAHNHAKTLEDKAIDEEKRPKAVAEAKEAAVDTKKQERESLFLKHKGLFGIEPAKNIGTEKLKALIAEKEAELATLAEETETQKTETGIDSDQSKESSGE